MNQLQKDVIKYVRVARKTRGALMNFQEFNKKHNTNIPEAPVAYEKFASSVRRARQRNEYPISGRLFNLYSELSKDKSPVVAPVVKNEVLPEASFAPSAHRSILPSPPNFTLEDYKAGLELWKKDHPGSKLNSETQIVFFVPNEPIDNYEHYAAKLTKSTGAVLETGGMFKMRSGLKKEILGLDKKVAKEIICKVESGKSGPFYLPMACVTGAAECKCTM